MWPAGQILSIKKYTPSLKYSNVSVTFSAKCRKWKKKMKNTDKKTSTDYL